MKKLLLTLALAFVGTLGFAEDTNEYLTLRKADGTTVSYKIDGLKLLFSDSQGITVETPEESTNYFTMDVDALLFSATDLTAIETIATENASETDATEIYTIDGRLVASGSNARQGLAAGIYIMKTGNKSTKISVR